MAKCKYETSNGRCGLKNCYAYRHKCYTEEFCKCHQPQTHGDQIRAMSDKELANLLASKMANIKELEMAEKGIRMTATQISLLASRLHDIWLQWLREPAEE